jgi:hypothetical protein
MGKVSNSRFIYLDLLLLLATENALAKYQKARTLLTELTILCFRSFIQIFDLEPEKIGNIPMQFTCQVFLILL